MVFRFFSSQLKLGPKVAGILTRLTTKGGHLPTGAPTSDALANLILSPADEEVVRLAEHLKLQKIGLAVPRKKVFNAGAEKPHTITGFNANGKTLSLSHRHRNSV